MAACGNKANLAAEAEEPAPAAAEVEEKKEEGDNPFEKYVGKWKLESNDNSGPYLTARGLGMVQRNLFKAINCTLTISTAKNSDGKYEVTVGVEATGGRKGEYKYTEGCSVDVTGLNGTAQTRELTVDANTKEVTVKTTWKKPADGSKPQFDKYETRTWTFNHEQDNAKFKGRLCFLVAGEGIDVGMVQAFKKET